MVLVRKENQIEELKAELARTRKSKSYYKNHADDLSTQLVAAKGEHNKLVSCVDFRPGSRNISLYGGYKMALSSSKGYASSQATLDVVAGDKLPGAFKDRSIFITFEHRLAAVYRVLSRTSYSKFEDILIIGINGRLILTDHTLAAGLPTMTAFG